MNGSTIKQAEELLCAKNKFCVIGEKHSSYCSASRTNEVEAIAEALHKNMKALILIALLQLGTGFAFGILFCKAVPL